MEHARSWVWARVNDAWRPASWVRTIERGRRKGAYVVETEELRLDGTWYRKRHVIPPDAVRPDVKIETKHQP